MFKRHILICESGWQKIREFSISLSLKNTPSIVLIKGRPDRQTRGMITGHKGVKNVFIPERLFKPSVFIYLFLNISTGRPLSLFAETKEKTYAGLVSLKKIFPRIELVNLSV